MTQTIHAPKTRSEGILLLGGLGVGALDDLNGPYAGVSIP